MTLPAFSDLPFNARPDLSPYLIHLTKNTQGEDGCTAYDNLRTILQTGLILGSDPKVGRIKGGHKAACFMDVPVASLKYVLTPENSDPQNPRYEPYGVVVTKKYAYKKGCRPVLYLSNQETTDLQIPKEELWRVVRFEAVKGRWISWLHEREWRCKGNFELPTHSVAALVRTGKEAKTLADELASKSGKFQCNPNSILPLAVVCQGFLK